jgi:hypothetical protein
VPNKWNMQAIKHRLSPHQIELLCELFISPVTFQARPRYVNEHRTLANLRKRGVIAQQKFDATNKARRKISRVSSYDSGRLGL